MPRLPSFDGNVCHNPHIVLLGAGASIAAFYDWGATGPKLPSMQDLLDILDIRKKIENYGFATKDLEFESFYDSIYNKKKYTDLASYIEDKVYLYFSQMTLPDKPTIYDYLILSLREKDLIATFNWDPFLLQAYMRCETICSANRPRIAFLHGNVSVGVCPKDRTAGVQGRTCSKCGRKLDPSKLLYPVRKKDYNSDNFIAEEWDVLRDYLKRGYYMTVFGYSAPKTDIEARSIILEFWQKNLSQEFCEVDIVDIKEEEEVEANWAEFFFSHHYALRQEIWSSYLFRFPRRSCDAFASATLRVDPWHENPFPRFDTLTELHSWIRPLLEEETRYENDRTPFSGDPILPNRKVVV